MIDLPLVLHGIGKRPGWSLIKIHLRNVNLHAGSSRTAQEVTQFVKIRRAQLLRFEVHFSTHQINGYALRLESLNQVKELIRLGTVHPRLSEGFVQLERHVGIRLARVTERLGDIFVAPENRLPGLIGIGERFVHYLPAVIGVASVADHRLDPFAQYAVVFVLRASPVPGSRGCEPRRRHRPGAVDERSAEELHLVLAGELHVLIQTPEIELAWRRLYDAHENKRNEKIEFTS